MTKFTLTEITTALARCGISYGRATSIIGMLGRIKNEKNCKREKDEGTGK